MRSCVVIFFVVIFLSHTHTHTHTQATPEDVSDTNPHVFLKRQESKHKIHADSKQNADESPLSEQTKVSRVPIRPWGSMVSDFSNMMNSPSFEFWFCTIGSVILILIAGMASGLTTGLMSLDPIQLRVLQTEGNEWEKSSAKRIFKLVSRHHLVLVTLLLTNSVAMESLPLFFDRLVPAWMAVLLSVTAILFFGEVLPQALCTGRHQFKIAASSAPIVQTLICLLWPVSFPISKLLDRFLGHEGVDQYYARSHLKALIQLHHNENDLDKGSAASSRRNLGADEVGVITGALDLATKTLSEIMVPLTEVYMLEIETKLNNDTIKDILDAGHSRIPIYKRTPHNLRGLLMVKNLIGIHPNDETRVCDVMTDKWTPIFAKGDANLYDLLNIFQQGRSHIAIVTEHPTEYKKALKDGRDVNLMCTIRGIATLEDVIEELIQEEILDEFDKDESSPRGTFNGVDSLNVPLKPYHDECGAICYASFTSDKSEGMKIQEHIDSPAPASHLKNLPRKMSRNATTGPSVKKTPASKPLIKRTMTSSLSGRYEEDDVHRSIVADINTEVVREKQKKKINKVECTMCVNTPNGTTTSKEIAESENTIKNANKSTHTHTHTHKPDIQSDLKTPLLQP